MKLIGCTLCFVAALSTFVGRFSNALCEWEGFNHCEPG
jgi:hypothetical protein